MGRRIFPPSIHPKALKAFRDLRIEAAARVPRLLEAIEGRVQQFIKSIEEADTQELPMRMLLPLRFADSSD
jgi:hypothetical protein